MNNIFFTQSKLLLRIRPFLFLVADIFLIALSVYLAFLLRFEGTIPDIYSVNIFWIILLAIVITIPVFYFFRLYFFTWAYVSTEELISLMQAGILSFLLLTAFFFIFRDHQIFSGFPRSTLLITYFFVFLLCGGIRFLKRIYIHTFLKGGRTDKERTLIVGAGDAGEQILRNFLSSKDALNFPIGFVDDNSASQGVSIHGFRVLGRIKDIPEIVKANDVKEIIIALPSAGSKIVREAVAAGRKAGVSKIKIIPSLNEIIDGHISIRDLRQIRVDDLLGRDSVSLNQKLIEEFIRGKSVLITGAAGSIGSELSYQVAKFQPSYLLILDQDETGIFNVSNDLIKKFPKLKIFPLVADIRDKDRIDQIFKEFRPNIIFHAAAYKHVPVMELNAQEAIKNNVFGTKIVTEAALENHAEKFIFISTDKAINPTSIMGATKRMGEMICQSLNQKNTTKFVSVRFGNVLDSRGSVIPIFREQIKKGGPVEVTHPEMKRYFMVNSEACLLVMEAGAIGRGGEVFVLDMGSPIKILDLAKEMIRLSGFAPDKDIPIVFTRPRPGEKLFEEILSPEEERISTEHKKIFITKLLSVDGNHLNSALATLKTLSSKEQITKALKEFIPTYQPDSGL